MTDRTLAHRRARRVLYAFVAAGTAVLVVGVTFGLTTLLNLTHAVRDTQIEGTPTGQKLLESSDRILDCTSPDGQCFKDGQARTAEAVGNINKVIVLAAACAVGVDPDLPVVRRQTLIQTCVIERLAADTP